MKHFVGIDLGTTFSSLSILDETGRPKIVHNSEGQNITPSCVTEIDGNYIVGEEARRTWVNDPEGESAAARFKRDMGTDQKHSINGKEFTPTDLSAMVLGKLIKDTKEQIGEIIEAVVTIPANFSHEARQATMDAAKAAGLNIRQIINEPTAAALSYVFTQKGNMRGVYAVYDLGGGTFDISIIKVNGYEVDVLATDGIRRLGGDDFDKVLQGIVAKKYQEKTGEAMEKRDYDSFEDDKKSLSKRSEKVIRASRQSLRVSRQEFEDGIADLVKQTEELCQSVINKAGISTSDISEVLLAGGSTRIPLVRETVKRVFAKDKLAETANVDEVVSMGAALYAAHAGYRENNQNLSPLQKQSLAEIKIEEITSKYFGVLALNDDEDLENFVIIEKNMRIPCQKETSVFTLADDQQAVRCRITESDTKEADPKKVSIILDQYLNELPPGRPRGQEIKVTYSYDANQIMHCSFVDVASGKKFEADLSMTQSGGGMLTIEAADIEKIE